MRLKILGGDSKEPTPLFKKTKKDSEINWGSPRRRAPPWGCDRVHV
jgi:hypothetical protein